MIAGLNDQGDKPFMIRIVSIGMGPELSILARSFSKAKWQETNKHEVYILGHGTQQRER